MGSVARFRIGPLHLPMRGSRASRQPQAIALQSGPYKNLQRIRLRLVFGACTISPPANCTPSGLRSALAAPVSFCYAAVMFLQLIRTDANNSEGSSSVVQSSIPSLTPCVREATKQKCKHLKHTGRSDQIWAGLDCNGSRFSPRPEVFFLKVSPLWRGTIVIGPPIAGAAG
jgi:hypothetical protein